MRVYIIKRLIEIVPTVLMITLVVFVMMRSIPGDPVVALLGDAYTEEDAVKIRAEYGLDQPVLVQYVIWLGKLVRGDWGNSILNGRPVLHDVLLRLPVTLELILLSMAVALDPEVCTSKSRHFVEVETRSELTRGMTVVDRFGRAKDDINQPAWGTLTSHPENVMVYWAIDVARWKRALFSVLRG